VCVEFSGRYIGVKIWNVRLTAGAPSNLLFFLRVSNIIITKCYISVVISIIPIIFRIFILSPDNKILRSGSDGDTPITYFGLMWILKCVISLYRCTHAYANFALLQYTTNWRTHLRRSQQQHGGPLEHLSGRGNLRPPPFVFQVVLPFARQVSQLHHFGAKMTERLDELREVVDAFQTTQTSWHL